MKTPIKQREADFHNEVMSVALEKYPQSMLDSFVLYWTEPNKSNTKMRFEGEKFFHIGRRLGTWAKNDRNWQSSRNTKVNKPEFLTPVDKFKQQNGL